MTALTALLSPNLATGQTAPNFQILCLYCSAGTDDILYYLQKYISAISSVRVIPGYLEHTIPCDDCVKIASNDSVLYTQQIEKPMPPPGFQPSTSQLRSNSSPTKITIALTTQSPYIDMALRVFKSHNIRFQVFQR